jgi:hypothetical protein
MHVGRKQRKRKWVLAGLMMVAGLVPVEAASPGLSPKVNPKQSVSVICSPYSSGGVVADSWGSCDLGTNCCSGSPEAKCDLSGHGFPSV